MLYAGIFTRQTDRHTHTLLDDITLLLCTHMVFGMQAYIVCYIHD